MWIVRGRESINQEVASEIDEVTQHPASVISIPPACSEPVQSRDVESAPTQPLYRWVTSEEEFCIGVARDVEGRSSDVRQRCEFYLGPVFCGGVFGLVSSELRQ